MAPIAPTKKLLEELDLIDAREDHILGVLLARGSRLAQTVEEAERRSRIVTVDDMRAVRDGLGGIEKVIDDLQSRIERAEAAATSAAAVPAPTGPETPTPTPTFDEIAASLRERNAEADRLRAMLRERLTALEPAVAPEPPAALRTFQLKRRPMIGADVKAFQRDLNARFAKWRINITIREDGRYGAQTQIAARRVARGLGVAADDLEHGITPPLRSLIRQPRGRRTPQQIERARRMRPWLDRLRKRYASGAQRPPALNAPAAGTSGSATTSRLAAAIRANGGRYEDIIIREARRAKLPVSLVCAVMDIESDFRNVFGHDPVPNPVKSPDGGVLVVTEELYRRYVKHRNLGKGNQGVGPMQLTARFLQDAADKRGGCWKPEVNIRVGVERLAQVIREEGGSVHEGLRRYNGSSTYPPKVLKVKRSWDAHLGSAAASPPPTRPRPTRPTRPKPGHPRPFKLTRPAIEGGDVAAFQRALNRRYAIWKIDRQVTVDGHYGSDTADAAREVMRGLGVDRAEYEHGITPRLRSLLRDPRKRRSPQQLARARRRRPWLAQLRRRYAATGAPAAKPDTKDGAIGIVDELVRIARRAGGEGVFVGSDHRPGDMLPSGAPSDHSENNSRRAARDIGVRGLNLLTGPPSPRLDKAVVAIGKTLGRDYGSGRSGPFQSADNVHYKGYRVQVIWRTPRWGGHMGHIHVGVRKD